VEANVIASRVVSGAIWLLSVQVLTAAIQLIYAAYSSRVVGEAAFGQYSVALSATALVSLIANSGLGMSASRMVNDTEEEIRAVSTVALLTGVVAAMVLVVFARPWAMLWGDQAAAVTIRVLALGLLVNPVVAVQMGLMRRNGRFQRLALGSIVSSVIGMLIGAWFISRAPTSASLVVSTVASSWLFYLFGVMTLRKGAIPSLKLRSSWPHLSFGMKSFVASFVNFLAATTPSIAISRVLGLPTLGQWNRATVLGVIPIEMVTNSLSKAIYPEAKNVSVDGDGEETARKIWTLSACLPSLIFWPLVGVAVPLMPSMVRTLLGSNWTVAGNMSQFLVIGAGVMLTLSVLTAVQESNGYFSIVWIGTASLLLCAVAGAVGLSILRSWVPVGVAAIVAPLIAVIIQVLLARRENLIDAALVFRSLGQAGTSALLLGAVTALAVTHLQNAFAAFAVVVVFIVIGYSFVLGLPQCAPVLMPLAGVFNKLRGTTI